MRHSDEGYEKRVSELQSATVDVDESTLAVTGTLYYQDNWTAYGAPNNKGYFVALKVSFGDVPADQIKVFTPLTEEDGGKNLGEDGIVVVRVAGKGEKIPADALRFEVAGQEFPVDLTGLTLGSTLSVSEPKDMILFASDDKRVSDLQSNVNITGPDKDGVINVSGDFKPITGWNKFSTDSKYNSGYFIALTLDLPDLPKGTEIYYQAEAGTEQVPNSNPKLFKMHNGDTLVWRMTGLNDMRAKDLVVEADGRQYTVKFDITPVESEANIAEANFIGAEEAVGYSMYDVSADESTIGVVIEDGRF